MRTPISERIAIEFTKLLREELSAADFEQMRRDNAVEQIDYICHSHDFVDANEVMYEAMHAVTSHEWLETNTSGGYSEDFCELWTESWDIAKNRWLS